MLNICVFYLFSVVVSFSVLFCVKYFYVSACAAQVNVNSLLKPQRSKMMLSNDEAKVRQI